MKRFLLGAALLAATSIASAAGPWAIGAGIGRSTFDDCTADSCDPRKEAYKVFAGYRLSRHLSLEAGYVDLGKTTAVTGSTFIETKPRGFAGHVVGLWPLYDRFSIVGRIGLIYGDSKVSGNVPTRNDKGANAAWGVGAQYEIGPDFIVRVDWDRYRFEASDIDTVMLVFMTTF